MGRKESNQKRTLYPLFRTGPEHCLVIGHVDRDVKYQNKQTNIRYNAFFKI